MVDVLGVELEVVDLPARSSSASAPLVFLHEGLGSASSWRDFPERLAEALGGPRSVVYSRVGYGRSTPRAGPWPAGYLHDEARAVLPALLAALGVVRPVLIGHSDGATIALLAAEVVQASSLVLFAPHVVVEERTLEGIRATRRAYRAGDLKARLARHHLDVDATFFGWADVWLSEAFRSFDIRPELGTVRCPVLVLQGSADPYGTLAQLDWVEAGVAGPCRRVVVNDGGHALWREVPEVVVEEVRGFLTGA
jgi:pimeloyl-ACP methyl ester carboxylesterase